MHCIFNFSNKMNQDLQNLNQAIQNALSSSSYDLYVAFLHSLLNIVNKLTQQFSTIPLEIRVNIIKYLPYLQTVIKLEQLARNQCYFYHISFYQIIQKPFSQLIKSACVHYNKMLVVEEINHILKCLSKNFKQILIIQVC
ncbi:hypothetical protein ABPG74_009284 [Tetrahymena malaccensis]